MGLIRHDLLIFQFSETRALCERKSIKPISFLLDKSVQTKPVSDTPSEFPLFLPSFPSHFTLSELHLTT